MTSELFTKNQLLILGAGGFIGFNLTKNAIAQGCTVCCVSKNFQWQPELFAQNYPEFTYIRANTQDVSSFIDRIDQFTNVIYMAGSTNIALAETQPGEDFLSHINSLSSCLLAINQAKSVIFLSSGGAVYGESSKKASKEDDCLTPISVYGKRNCMMETIFQSILKQKTIPFCILRVANPYGSDQLIVRRTGLVFSIIQSWMQGKSILLRDKGRQERDYIHIEDLSMFLLQLITIDLSVIPNIINVGSGMSYTGTEVASLIRSSLNIDGRLEFVDDFSNYDVKSSRLDVSLLKKVVNHLNCSKDLFMPLKNTLSKENTRFLSSAIF